MTDIREQIDRYHVHEVRLSDAHRQYDLAKEALLEVREAVRADPVLYRWDKEELLDAFPIN